MASSCQYQPVQSSNMLTDFLKEMPSSPVFLRQKRKCVIWSASEKRIMDSIESMTSNKPYLIRALNEWILDNQMTPLLLVNANVKGVAVPEQHVKDGKIVLNVAPSAVQEITFEDEGIYFSARFSGQPCLINIPINAVLAIYARENGRGMMFAGEESLAADNAEIKQKESSNKPVLSIVN